MLCTAVLPPRARDACRHAGESPRNTVPGKEGSRKTVHDETVPVRRRSWHDSPGILKRADTHCTYGEPSLREAETESVLERYTGQGTGRGHTQRIHLTCSPFWTRKSPLGIRQPPSSRIGRALPSLVCRSCSALRGCRVGNLLQINVTVPRVSRRVPAQVRSFQHLGAICFSVELQKAGIPAGAVVQGYF